MAKLPTGLVSHRQKVCSLYKRAVRAIEDWYPDIVDYRYRSVLMRARFDENANIKDMRKAKELLLNGEEEYFQNQHPQPKKFANTIGGIAYGRTAHRPDWMLDYWHPMEKARYPKFFARREELKKEYLEMFYKKYPEERPGYQKKE